MTLSRYLNEPWSWYLCVHRGCTVRWRLWLWRAESNLQAAEILTPTENSVEAKTSRLVSNHTVFLINNKRVTADTVLGAPWICEKSLLDVLNSSFIFQNPLQMNISDSYHKLSGVRSKLKMENIELFLWCHLWGTYPKFKGPFHPLSTSYSVQGHRSLSQLT